MFWFLRLGVMFGGKNFARKTLMSSSHVMMHPGGKEWSHTLSLSLGTNGNNCNWMALMETPLSFNVSHTSKNTKKCKLESSNGVPPIGIITHGNKSHLQLKVACFYIWSSNGREMLWTYGVTKSLTSFFCHLLLPPSLKMLLKLWLFTPLTLTSSS